MITRGLVRWLDDRLGFSGLARKGLDKIFPDHWSFMLGEIALYAFAYLVLSGVYLTFFFKPSLADTVYHGAYAPLRDLKVSAAYASTLQLSFDVRLGLVVRQSHHWAALLFLGAILVHLARIFLTGAFRRPRELNWVVGVTLLILGIVNGFAGYSMPDDLLSGTGLRVANGIMLSIPVVGTWLSFLVFGGEFPGQEIVHRLYVAHVLLIPALITALISVHMVVLIKQKHTQFPGPGRTERNVVGSRLWPGYAVKSLGLMMFVFATCLLLGGIVQINPIWIWGPFEPGAVSGPAQPDWYIGWVDGALRLYGPWEPVLFGYRLPNLFLPGVLLPGVSFLVLYAWPWVEKLVTRDTVGHELLEHPREVPFRVCVGAWAFTFYGLLLASFSTDVIARYGHVSVYVVLRSFQYGVVIVPLVAGWVALVLARALKRTGKQGVLHLTWSDLRPPRPDRERPAQPVREEHREQPRPQPAPQVPEEHLPVEVGPAP